MPSHPVLFDAHLHPDGLTREDLRSMAAFGVRGALLPSRDALLERPEDFVAHFEALLLKQADRLWRLGLRPFAALGVHPARIPWMGLEQVMAAIPRLAFAGRLVAIGEIGLEKGGAREEQVLERQLELAASVNLPVLVQTPPGDREPLARRTLAILRRSGLSPGAVLVGHADGRSIKAVRACGYAVGLTVAPGRLSPEDVAGLVRRHGSEGIVLGSHAGDGAYDVLALPRTASVLRERGLSARVVERVLCDNALAFLGLSRGALERSPPRVPGRR